MSNPLLKSLGPEARLNAELVKYIRYQYPTSLMVHVPNEGRRTKAERYSAKVLGILSGVPDLLIFDPRGKYHGLAIELKIKPNKPTDSQARVLKDLAARHWSTAVVYDLDEGIKIVDDYFKL